MNQITKELTLIGIVLAITLIAYFFIRRSGGTPKQNISRVLSGVLGAFMVLGGVAKFFDPFTTMFAQQINLSQLPFPQLSAIAGQTGEISAGLVLLAFFVVGSRKLTHPLANVVFYLTNLLIVVIMLVAVYVHLHPDVPATVLPFQSKPPIVTLIVMGLAILNAWLYRCNEHSVI